MAGIDEHRRRPVWAAALVALALAVPALVLLLREGPATEARGEEAVTAAVSTTEAQPARSVSSAQPAGSVSRSKPRALFFGDSYFIGGGYTDEGNSMARLASNRLGWASEINGGGGTGFVQTNWEYDLGNYLDQIAQGAFDVGARRWVVIEGGNNDRSQSMDAVNRNARKVLRKAQRRFPNATVVLVGPLDTDGDWSDTTPVVKTLRKAAARRGVPFVNAKRWLAGHYDQIGSDYVHPTPKGHRILGRKLAEALRHLGA